MVGGDVVGGDVVGGCGRRVCGRKRCARIIVTIVSYLMSRPASRARDAERRGWVGIGRGRGVMTMLLLMRMMLRMMLRMMMVIHHPHYPLPRQD